MMVFQFSPLSTTKTVVTAQAKVSKLGRAVSVAFHPSAMISMRSP